MPYRLRQAFQALRSGRPQPAMVDMTEDVADGSLTMPFDYQPVRQVRSAADFGAVREAADRLLRAKLPLLWAGNGVLYAEATAEFQELAELLGAPVMNTLMGKSALPTSATSCPCGTGGHAKTAAVMHYLEHADVVLAVGSSISQSSFTPAIPPGKTLIHATNDARDLNKVHQTAVAIAADAKLFLGQLLEELRGRVGEKEKTRRAEVAAKIASLKKAWRAEYENEFSDEGTPINGYRMFRELWNVLDPDTTMLTHESGASRDIQCVFYESTVPRSYLGWGHSTQLGFSLGLAMGAKLANPDKTVVNVMGDGAIGMTGHGPRDGVAREHPDPDRDQARLGVQRLPAELPRGRRRSTTRSARAATTRASRRRWAGTRSASISRASFGRRSSAGSGPSPTASRRWST